MSSLLKISDRVSLSPEDIEITAVRAQGAGGQHVNKAATAVHLRFDISASSLPDYYKRRLLKSKDRRINRDGVIVIKAQEHRSQDRNHDAALERLRELVRAAGRRRKPRIATGPTRAARERRLSEKSRRGRLKRLRDRPRNEE